MLASIHRLALAAALTLPLAACGGDDDDTTPDAAATADAAPTTSDAGSEFTSLIGADWTLAPGTELYQCTRVTVTRDWYINKFTPVIPAGTHHTVVTLATPGTVADGTYECTNPFEGSGLMIYGTGVGSNPHILPAGTAVKIPAGTQVVLNLHLYNVNDAPLSGHSDITVAEMPEADVVNVARIDLFGKINGLIIPPGVQTQSATCTVANEVTVFSTSAHMHQLGTHLKGTVQPVGGGAAYSLFDEDYDFNLQTHTDLSPMQVLHPGDVLTVDCTYDNTTAGTVTFGESSTDEMCFMGLFLYPYTAQLCGP